jgi:hypothetical protein
MSRGRPTFDHEIFGNHLDEIDRNAGFEKLRVMRLAQTEAETVHGDCSGWATHAASIEAAAWRDYLCSASVRLPPAALHCSSVIVLKPCPLQLFIALAVVVRGLAVGTCPCMY